MDEVTRHDQEKTQYIVLAKRSGGVGCPLAVGAGTGMVSDQAICMSRDHTFGMSKF